MKKALVLCSVLALSQWGTVGRTEISPITPSPTVLDSQPVLKESALCAFSQAPTTGDASTSGDLASGVIELGAEPRQVFRYKPTVGQTQRSKLQMSLDATISFDDGPSLAPPFPTFEFLTESETQKIDDDGLIHTSFRFIEANVNTPDNEDSPSADILRSSLDSLSGLEVYYVFDQYGKVQSFDIKTPEDLKNSESSALFKQLGDSIEQSFGNLPETAIGIGAIWTSPQSVSLNGLNLQQTAVYRLVDVQGDQLKLDMCIKAKGNGFPTTLPANFSSGGKANIESLNVFGAGTMTLDLQQPAASAIDISTQVQLVTAFEQNGQKSVANMDMTSQMIVTPEAESEGY